MTYLTALDLLQSPGALELGQVASDEHGATVDAVLMSLTITAGDRTAYTADEIARADAALVRIARLIADVGELIDGYLVGRYPQPLNPVPGILRAWATDIFRFRLHANLQDGDRSPVSVRYRDAIKSLGLVRDGKLSLGGADPIATSSEGGVRISAPERVFTHDTLADY
ncbi:MAG: DUF1320 domain-containing protein [Xanthomonadaceae bacterium]|nr:DUF1320 domain-containing protein [Xanthomonadaceae bacterium]MDP2185023.1 DUF1320 domain-containing protein [Xanthomonadales bacterium]MDZ4114402.1 DUF1320 domain-containing protein [Xanthomonadaceae bacterium]